MLENFTLTTITEARAMAEAINGGSWDTDYSDAQKVGWCLKVEWAMKRYDGALPYYLKPPEPWSNPTPYVPQTERYCSFCGRGHPRTEHGWASDHSYHASWQMSNEGDYRLVPGIIVPRFDDAREEHMKTDFLNGLLLGSIRLAARNVIGIISPDTCEYEVAHMILSLIPEELRTVEDRVDLEKWDAFSSSRR